MTAGKKGKELEQTLHSEEYLSKQTARKNAYNSFVGSVSNLKASGVDDNTINEYLQSGLDSKYQNDSNYNSISSYTAAKYDGEIDDEYYYLKSGFGTSAGQTSVQKYDETKYLKLKPAGTYSSSDMSAAMKLLSEEPDKVRVDYYDENDELICIETDPMYLSDVEGILVLDEEGLHVENSYLFQSVGDRNTKTIPVSGTFAGEEEETEVYCVDMEWGSLEFVFTPYVEWNPETHTYDPVEDTPGTWDLAENANNHVRITNHSNVGIDIGLTFKGHEEYGVKGAFFTDTDGNGDVITGFTVPSAVGTEVEAAPYDVAFLRITDGTIPEDLSGPASFVDEAGNAMIGEILVAITAIETEQ
jgi:hypothetical protein